MFRVCRLAVQSVQGFSFPIRFGMQRGRWNFSREGRRANDDIYHFWNRHSQGTG